MTTHIDAQCIACTHPRRVDLEQSAEVHGAERTARRFRIGPRVLRVHLSHHMVPMPQWREAACTRAPWLFDADLVRAGTPDADAALDLCLGCADLDPCRSRGEAHEVTGIWGGLRISRAHDGGRRIIDLGDGSIVQAA